MTKVYKMPVLMAFYNNGNMRLDVTDAQLLDAWKTFFDQNGNWKDLDKNMSYEKYKSISDKDTYYAGSFPAGIWERILRKTGWFCNIAEK